MGKQSTPATSRPGIAAWTLLLVRALLLAATAMPAAAAPGEVPFSINFSDPRMLVQAELAVVDSAMPPPASADWQPVQLPDSWRTPQRYLKGTNGWYRFRLPGLVPTEPQSVYLWRFSMNASVVFNGEWIGDGGSFEEPVARNWNRPLLLRLPSSMWRSDSNELMVRLKVYPGFGHMLPVAVGPTRLLKPDHDSRHLAQILTSQAAAVLMLLALLAGLALWLIDRRETVYLCFAGLSASLLVYSLNKFVLDLWMPARVWWWLVHTAVDSAGLMTILFAHRLFGTPRPRLERAMALLLALLAALYAYWDLPQLARFNPITHALFMVGLIYMLAWVGRRCLNKPSLESGLYAASLAALVGAGAYDQLLNSLLVPALWREGFYMLTLSMPALFVALMFQLGLRSARAVQALRLANETLETRVTQAGTEIASTYSRERRLLAERSAGQERERIYRDLHDNLGARLLGLVYGAGDDRQRAMAREALSEMRTIVATSQVDAGQLADLAEEWQLEAELRCESAGLDIRWACEGDLRISGRQRYQLERIARELISNAIEHAQAKHIEVAWHVAIGQLVLRVADDGLGMPAGQAPAGVRARAADLLGQARWEARDGGGTLCVVSMPVDASQLPYLPTVHP